MHIKLRVRSSAIATLIAILVAMYFCQVPCDSKAFEMKSQESFLTLLPATTQAVVVANGPFQLQNLSNIEKLAFTNFLPPVTEPLRWYCSLAQNVELVAQRSIYEFVSTKKILRAAKIILSFVPDPKIRNEVRDWRECACNVLIYEPVDSGDWNQLKQLLNNASYEKYTDSGCEVFVCRTDSEREQQVRLNHLDKIQEAYKKQLVAEGKRVEAENADYLRRPELLDREILISAPQNGLVLTVYGDRASMHQILDRLARNRMGRDGLLPQLPEWKFVRTDGDIYALRHFGLSGTKDPTSPRLGTKVTTEKRKVKDAIDSKGVGFVLNLIGQDLQYVYLSDSDNLPSVAQQLFPRELTIKELTSKKYFRRLQKGFEIKMSKSESEANLSWPIALYWLGNR